MKLEHGKKYVTHNGKIVGPVYKLHDGRFSFEEYVWDEDGAILTSAGRASLASPSLSISHKFQGVDESVNVTPKLQRAADTFLDKVKGVVTGPREKEYGDKTHNHVRIAKLWNMWINETKEDGDEITPYDVAVMMLMVKLGRLMQTPGHQDSHIDIAGYAACMEEIYDRQ